MTVKMPAQTNMEAIRIGRLISFSKQHFGPLPDATNCNSRRAGYPVHGRRDGISRSSDWQLPERKLPWQSRKKVSTIVIAIRPGGLRTQAWKYQGCRVAEGVRPEFCKRPPQRHDAQDIAERNGLKLPARLFEASPPIETPLRRPKGHGSCTRSKRRRHLAGAPRSFVNPTAPRRLERPRQLMLRRHPPFGRQVIDDLRQILTETGQQIISR